VHARIVSYDDPTGLTQAMDGVSRAVHLAGILIERKGQRYESANVGTARATASAAAAAGLEHIVLISVIGADPGSSNPYLRSKGEAERAAAGAGIPCTVLRTPILIGPGTAGADSLLRNARTGRARLLGGGAYTMRPLDLDDLSRAIISSLERKPAGTETFELVGPEAVSYRALVERVAKTLGRDVSFRAAPIWLSKLGAFVSSKVTGGGITPAVIDVITADEVVDRNAAADLGLQLTPLSETLRKIVPPDQRET
jgi:NADH dehydrogenase